jgi:hypothetical protein
LVRADGFISREDEAVIDEIRLSMNDVDFSLFGKLSNLLSGPRQRRGEAMADAPNREKYLDEFINNKVYYGVRRRLDLGEGVDIDIDDVRLRRLSAVGGLLARVAKVDLNVTDDEFNKIVEMLQKYWELIRRKRSLWPKWLCRKSAPTWTPCAWPGRSTPLFSPNKCRPF